MCVYVLLQQAGEGLRNPGVVAGARERAQNVVLCRVGIGEAEAGGLERRIEQALQPLGVPDRVRPLERHVRLVGGVREDRAPDVEQRLSWRLSHGTDLPQTPGAT